MNRRFRKRRFRKRRLRKRRFRKRRFRKEENYCRRWILKLKVRILNLYNFFLAEEVFIFNFGDWSVDNNNWYFLGEFFCCSNHCEVDSTDCLMRAFKTFTTFPFWALLKLKTFWTRVRTRRNIELMMNENILEIETSVILINFECEFWNHCEREQFLYS